MRYDDTERVFKALQICTAGYMAFAYGANDVGNGIAPLAAIWSVSKHEMATSGQVVPLWILLLGASGIIVGFAIHLQQISCGSDSSPRPHVRDPSWGRLVSIEPGKALLQAGYSGSSLSHR